MTRARKDHQRCEAHRRDGQRCRAPAVPGGYVCKLHGGSAPQVRIKAGRTLRLERVFEAWQEVEKQEHGTERWYQAWDRFSAAERDLGQYESDLDLVALMKATLVDGTAGERAWLLRVARDRLTGRPWTSPLRAQAMNDPGRS